MREKKDIRLPSGKIVYDYPETSAVKPPENTMKASPQPKYLGGGWFQLADGRKVRKKDLEEGD